MGFISGLFSGDKGSNFQAQGATIDNPFSTDAVATQQVMRNQDKQVQDAYGKQQAFVDAVNAQNGLGNQTSVFNQLQGVANGTGPNPAQAQLANATGQNAAQQAAMMAGQRGASANAGLMARQAGMLGANVQQQAAGQGAALQAQQSLGALGQMGGLANQQAAQQQQAVLNQNQLAQAEQQQQYNALQQQNANNIAMQSNINNTNAAIAGGNQKSQSDALGGIASGVGAAFGLAEGGKVPDPKAAPTSAAGKFLKGFSNTMNPQPQPVAMQQFGHTAGAALGTGLKALGQGLGIVPGAPAAPLPATTLTGAAPAVAMQPMVMAKGGKVPVMLSPGEKYLTPEKAKAVKDGKADPLKEGKTVPGKAKVKGDSYANDTVPAKLEKGGIVIPRSVLESDRPMANAIKFVHAYMAKGGMVKGKKGE